MKGTRVLVDDSKFLSMRPCAVTWALSQSQSMLEKRIERELKEKRASLFSRLYEKFQKKHSHIPIAVFFDHTKELVEYSCKSDANGAYNFIVKPITKVVRTMRITNIGRWMTEHFKRSHFVNGSRTSSFLITEQQLPSFNYPSSPVRTTTAIIIICLHREAHTMSCLPNDMDAF